MIVSHDSDNKQKAMQKNIMQKTTNFQLKLQ